MKTSHVFVAFVSTLASVVSLSAGTITGRVFLDANGNGVFDAGEKGVAGCVVSDERTLARTGDDGSYRLELPAGPADVFIVNAPGTWPVARWWVHVADGTADATVDFPLRAQEQSGPLYFVHGTDTHFLPTVESSYRRYIEHVNALPVPVRFVVHTGDLIMDALQGTPRTATNLFSAYLNASGGLKPPLRNVMGNHDVVGVMNPKMNPTDPGYGKVIYREMLGPVSYAFRFGRYHFIALDGTTIKDRSAPAGLTKESADWAISYLAGVGRDEPIVLLIHQPMYPEEGGVRLPDTPRVRPHEGRLLAALKGRKVLVTLAGHVHGRAETTWGGAPHVLGGAVSYAWHGIVPYPPTPRGYLLWRLDGDHIEHVYLDWAEERSIDVAKPEFTSLVRGRQKINGVVADFAGDITGVDCALGGQTAAATISRRGSLATAFDVELDSSTLADGAYDLLVTARAGDKKWEERQPVVVVNGKPAEFAATAGARLKFRIDGKLSGDSRVLCNGNELGAVPPAAEAEFDVAAMHLRRLNEIVIRSGAPTDPKAKVNIKAVALEYNGKLHRDVRYSPLARRPVPITKASRPAELVSYIDLTHE